MRADHVLRPSIRVVGKTDAGTKIVIVRIDGLVHGPRRTIDEAVRIHYPRKRIEDDRKFLILRFEHGIPISVVAQPEVDRQLWRDSPVILNKKPEFRQVYAKRGLPYADSGSARDVSQQVPFAGIGYLWIADILAPAAAAGVYASKLE